MERLKSQMSKGNTIASGRAGGFPPAPLPPQQSIVSTAPKANTVMDNGLRDIDMVDAPNQENNYKQKTRDMLNNSDTSKVGIAAIMASIRAEAGEGFDPNRRQDIGKGKTFKKGGGAGLGLFQMEGPMQKAVKERYGEWTHENQIKFALDEVKSGKHIGAGNAKKIREAFASGSTDTAVRAFTKYFERPKDQGEGQMKKRSGYASQELSEINKT